MAIIFTDFAVQDREVTFGTCELCMHTGTATESTFVFEDTATGEKVYIDNYEWDWGDFWEDLYPIDNLINFGHFVKSKAIQSFDDFNFQKLYADYKAEFEPEEEY